MKNFTSHAAAYLLAAILGAASFGLTVPLAAAVIVDQEVDLPRSGFNDISSPQTQSFQQAADNIAGAAVRIDSMTGGGAALSGSITLSILDALPGTGGNLIASGTALAMSGTPAADGEIWFSVFWTAVAVIPEAELFLAVTSDNGDISLSVTNASPYLRGQLYLNGSPYKKGVDLDFRTFTDTGLSVSVPEPGVLTIFAVGLADIAATRRRQSAIRPAV
jgi:hypothetical protein